MTECFTRNFSVELNRLLRTDLGGLAVTKLNVIYKDASDYFVADVLRHYLKVRP